MHLSTSAIALGLLASAAVAQPINHHAHRREAEPVEAYVTVYETHYVTAGQTVPSVETATHVANQDNAAAAATPVVTSTTAAAPEAPSSTSEASSSSSSAAAPSSVEASSTSSSAPAETSSAPTASSSVSAGSAGALGITYTPYTSNGGCKTSDEVAEDLKKISDYSIIRLYGTDCNQIENVYNAKGDNQKLFVGVFDIGNIQSSCQAIHDGIKGDWDSVHTVNIGNELVNDGEATVDQVAGYVQQGRSALKSLGYNGPVVAVDTFIATINNPGLCKLSDYIAVNAHAYFDGGVTSEQAGSWVQQQIERVWSACGGSKPVTIVETGWPSKGKSNGKANASPNDQSAAIDSIKSSVGNDAYLFTAFNDLWKQPGYLDVEQFWGIYGDASA